MKKKLVRKIISLFLAYTLLSVTFYGILSQSTFSKDAMKVNAETPDASDSNIVFDDVLINFGYNSTAVDCDVDSNGNIFVVDANYYTAYKLKKYSPTGTLIWSTGSHGTNTGQLNVPKGLAIDNLGNVYVADNGNNRIVKYNSSGTYIGTLNGYAGYSLIPNDIAYNKVANTLFIIDSANRNIVEIDTNLNYNSYFPIPTAFNNPECICFDAAGNYFIADNYTEKIIKYNSSRAQIAAVSGSNFNFITDLYCDGSNLYVSTGNDLLKYSATDLSHIFTWDLYACYSFTKAADGKYLISGSNVIYASRVVSNNNYLTSVTVDNESLSPAFEKNTSEYTVSIPSSKASVNIRAVTEDPKAKLYINGYMVASNSTFNVPIYGTADHIVTIYVISESGKTRTYKITIKIIKSTNSYLSSITVDGMSLTPAFNKDILDYTVYVPPTTSSITLTPFAEDSKATIYINGRWIISGTAFTYPVGAAGTMFIIDVIPESSEVPRTYKVNVVTTLPPDILIIKASDSCCRFDGKCYTGVALGDDADSALKFNISGIEGNIYEASLNITTFGGWV